MAPGGGVVYDVGANWGYYGVLLATNPAFSGTVHAFEAAPGTYRDLEATMDAAGLGHRVTCHRGGLSSGDGELPPVEGRRALSRRPPVAGDGAENTLAPVPLPIGERMARRLDLNVVAWPRDRDAGITARFETAPFSAELLELS